MPKIIDQVENKILEAAKRKMFEDGLNDFSLRSIAKDCDIAVSTIYNYFKNKEKLIETILLEDWFNMLYKADLAIENSSEPEECFIALCSAIREFVSNFDKVWNQFHGSIYAISSRHQIILDQISLRIERILTRYGYQDEMNFMNILSECVLVCSTHNDISMDEYLRFIKHILKR